MTALVDVEARRRVLEDLDTTLLVEAAAGSGKTTLLLGRIVTLVRAGRARLSEIAAITFTEKAAAELKVRLRAALWREGLHQALLDLESARIGTIHAFAGTLLRERPVEAGVDPGFAVADPLAAGLLLDAVWERWLPASLSEPSDVGSAAASPTGQPGAADRQEAMPGETGLDPARAAVQRAIALGVSLDTLRELAFALVEERDRLDGLPGPAPEAEPLPGLNAELRAGIARLEALAAASVRKPDDRMAQALAALGDWARQTAGLPEPDQHRALLESAPYPDKAATLGAKTKWRDPLRLQECRDALAAAHARIQAARAVARHDLVVALARWARGFVDAYQARKARAGVLDFHDLLLRARDLVRDRPDVRRAFQRRIRYLLVDEFQDTDPLQLEMILSLADGALPGSLFIVGDPKQSIYRFRRADIETYEAAKQRIAHRGAVVSVRVNFRSDGALLEAINRVFDGVMIPPPDGAYQPPYVPLEPSPETRPGAPPIVLAVPAPAGSEAGPPTRVPVGDSLASEARALAAWLREEGRAGRLEYGHVAILFRAMTAVALYEDALRDAGVPFRTVGGRHYYDRSEVGWAIACLSAIEDPHDPVALVGALRSPFFGVSDADLLALRIAGAEWSYLRDLPPGAPETARPAWATLRELHELRNAVAPPALVERLFVRTQVLAAYALDPEGEGRVANLLKVLDTARALEATGVLTFRGFVRWLAARGAARYEEEESALEGEGAVRLMTVHRAKGLEFPVVVVADLGREGRSRVRPTLVERTGRVEINLGQVEGEPLTTLGWEAAEAGETARSDAEALRLLYVALTRAERRLVLPMPAGAPPGSFAFHLEGLLGEVPGVRPSPEATAARGRGPCSIPSRVTISGPPESLSQWRAARSAVLARAAEASAPVVRPSTRRAAPDRGPRGGDGRRLGALVHAALAAIDLKNTEEAPAIVAALGARHGVSADLVAAAVQRVERALKGPVLARARAARWVAREWPVTAEVEGALVDGRIDLVFEDGEGLVVAEFKVEGDPDDAGEQARLYAQAVARATGRPVREVLVVPLSG